MKKMKSRTLILLLSIFFTTVVNAQDWPNLGRFRDANEELKKQS